MNRLILLLLPFLFSIGHAQNKAPIRIALSAAFVSETGAGVYDDILKYVTSKTGLPLELTSGLSYETINSMIVDGALGGGFVCGLPFVLLNEASSVIDLAVAPVMKNPRYNGRQVYYSELIVHKDSPYKKFHDLKGKIFAYNDELSNSGYNMPRYFFLKNKLPKGFFKKILRTGSHEESIRYVATKQADFSFVDSLVLEYELYLNSANSKNVRVIKSLGPVGIPPLVFSKKLDKKVAQKIKEALTNMHNDPLGRKILDRALVLRIEAVNYSNYKEIQDTYNYAKVRNALVIEK